MAASTNRNLVLVSLRGRNCVVVRDVTDISHATTVGAFDGLFQPGFVSATVLSYVDQNSLIRLPLAGSPKTLVAKTIQGVIAFAWSPDGGTAAYVTQGNSGMALHLVSAGRDRVVGGSMPSLPAVGCESQTCADAWDLRLLYSPDGAFISFVDSVARPVFRIWTSGGSLVKSVDSQSQNMSVWSGNNLYFRDANGVEVWRAGVVSPFLPGVVWIRPKASPGGGQIVYEVRDSAGWAHTEVVDTATRKVRDLGKGRAEPAFLTSRYIWYYGERLCTAADPCMNGLFIATGKTYIYDLQDVTETESIITSVADVWPHPA